MLGDLKMFIRDHWNERAATYDASPHHAIISEAERTEWSALFTSFIGRSPLKIIDVGAGTGEIALLLAGMGHQVTGTDIAEEMLAQARAKASARKLATTFMTGDAEALPFPDACFDVVVNRHLLWTLPDPEQALVEWKRVLIPGGKMVIIDGDFRCGAGSTQSNQRHKPSIDVYLAHGFADRLPLQVSKRPQADLQMLSELGLIAQARFIGPGGDFFVDLPFGARHDHCRFALFVEKLR